MEGILTLGILSEQSSPGHRLESAQNLVWNVVLRVLVRMWGGPRVQSLLAYNFGLSASVDKLS